jgi:hypothetical protein
MSDTHQRRGEGVAEPWEEVRCRRRRTLCSRVTWGRHAFAFAVVPVVVVSWGDGASGSRVYLPPP